MLLGRYIAKGNATTHFSQFSLNSFSALAYFSARLGSSPLLPGPWLAPLPSLADLEPALVALGPMVYCSGYESYQQREQRNNDHVCTHSHNCGSVTVSQALSIHVCVNILYINVPVVYIPFLLLYTCTFLTDLVPASLERVKEPINMSPGCKLSPLGYLQVHIYTVEQTNHTLSTGFI